MHMGYIQFEDEISLAEVVNLIGIKKMQFRMARDMFQHVTDFETFCMQRESMYYRITVPHEFKSVHCDDVCDLSEGDADETSVRADVFEACSTRSSSIATDLFAGSW